MAPTLARGPIFAALAVQPLVPMTTFMSPADAAAHRNGKAQRSFTGAALVPAAVAALAREWDLVRVVCRQPYATSPTDAFGIARIAIMTDTPSAAAAAGAAGSADAATSTSDAASVWGRCVRAHTALEICADLLLKLYGGVHEI